MGPPEYKHKSTRCHNKHQSGSTKGPIIYMVYCSEADVFCGHKKKYAFGHRIIVL